jgi:hypothetical protein
MFVSCCCGAGGCWLAAGCVGGCTSADALPPTPFLLLPDASPWLLAAEAAMAPPGMLGGGGVSRVSSGGLLCRPCCSSCWRESSCKSSASSFSPATRLCHKH